MDGNKKLVNIFVNENEKSKKTADLVKKKLIENDFLVIEDFNDKAFFNICIGGDGSFLRAVHKTNYSKIPFVGINTGHLGFYQEILIPNIDKFIKDLKTENFSIEKLYLVDANIHFKNSDQIKKEKTLNEFNISSNGSNIVYLDVHIDEHYLETFAGDGLIISSPSGSTAYNFSAGGAILYHNLDGIQMTPVAPINSRAYRSLSNSIVIPRKSKITTYLRESSNYNIQTKIYADGMDKTYENMSYIDFSKSNDYINRLVFENEWYWVNIKDKFL